MSRPRGATDRNMADVSMKRAQKRSEKAGPVFFNGEEALREVAKEDGLWNWALVGPDPKRLSLSGGGMGGVEEMRGAVENHAHSFGLLRMTFGLGAKAKTKFVLVHASDSIDSGNFTQMQHGKAMACKPEMNRAIRGFCAVIAAEIHILSAEECIVQNVINKLSGVVRGVEAKLITEDNFKAAVEQHKADHPEEVVLEQEREKQKSLATQMIAPRAEVAPPEREVGPATGPSGRLRKRIKLHIRGDMVELFSESSARWVDGEIEDVANESRTVNGRTIPAGSVKVSFNSGALVEWVLPSQVETHIRPSPRPRAPTTLVGTWRQEMHGWTSQRHVRYFELSKGFLRWWDSEASAKTGRSPINTMYLLGLQQERQGLDLKLRTTTSMGALFTFEAPTEADAQRWYDTLWAHAGYCHDKREYAETKQTSNQVREELLRFVRMETECTLLSKARHSASSAAAASDLGGA